MATPTIAAPVNPSSLQACRLRVSRLTAGGAPEVGANNAVVSSGLISIASALEIETGEEFTQKNGCGDICVSFKDRDRIKRANLSALLCQLDNHLLELMTGSSVITAGGEVIGLQIPDEDTVVDPVCVEAWTKAWDGTTQATDDNADALYWHFVWPLTTWTLGDHTLENGVLRVPVRGDATRSDQIENGPFNDWPATITSAEAWFLDTEIPPAVTGYIDVPTQS